MCVWCTHVNCKLTTPQLIQMDCLAFYWMVDTTPLANLDVDVMKVTTVILYRAHVMEYVTEQDEGINNS